MKTKHIHVLIVEDNETQALFLKKWLESREEADFTTEAAFSFEAAKKHLAFQPTDVVLLDLGMEDSPRDETEMVTELRNISPNVKLIVLTGWDGEELEKKLKEAGADAFFKKPANLVDLSIKIQQAVVYRDSEERWEKVANLISQLGPAMVRTDRKVGDSGGFKFPNVPPKE